MSGSKEAGAATPVTFGAIKRHVGVGQKLFGGGAVIGVEGYADAYSNIGGAAVEIERGGEGLDQLARQRRGGLGL